MEEIRAATILPAIREDITFTTSDGEVLVGELALPNSAQPKATLITLHPLPTHGGFMDSHILRKASNRLPALAEIAVLRFNTRGTSSPRGTSTGAFDGGVAERFDVAAAISFAQSRGLENLWLVGWSFGTELAIKYGPDHQISGAILLSPPLHRANDQDLMRWVEFGKPLVALVPGDDDYLKPDEAAKRFSIVPQAKVLGFEGEKHLWVGERATRLVLNQIVQTVLPGSAELPESY
ncbi:alpha/beta hydrolase [Aquiluna borgnonia]|uniref:Alpha/beta hydrolase n=1 Tax=Aquiluna borgnonia TaxID=2499157 RepID=A0A7D4Q3W8_9MICO|nr:alpha/beta hydrolase [Aquiluna borgnonia]QKJ25089.1 alpha/beta hydrolase [Aquiluna borgnonia]